MAESINIVLGGTSGLGQSITERLRDDGERAMVLGSSYDDEKHGEGMQVDLASEDSVESAVDKLEAQLGLGFQALKSFWWVSGYGYNGDFIDQENPERMALVNFGGALPLVQFAEQKFAEQNNGTLVVVSSTTGVKKRSNEAVYGATKAAQVHFARCMGEEVMRLSPRSDDGSSAKVALFMPGGMRTPFWDDAEPESFETYNDPRKVAGVMVDAVNAQTDQYAELTLERGSLV